MTIFASVVNDGRSTSGTSTADHDEMGTFGHAVLKRGNSSGNAFALGSSCGSFEALESL